MEKAPKTFKMNHSVFMTSTGKTRHLGTQFQASSEAEEAELLALIPKGSVVLVEPKKKVEEKAKPATAPDAGTGNEPPKPDATDDITEVPGVGAATLTKLAGLTPPVTTKSALKKFVTESPDQVKELVGATSYARIVEYFEPANKPAAGADQVPGSSRDATK